MQATSLSDDIISTHTLTWSVTRNRGHRRWNVRFQLTRSRGAWLFFFYANLVDWHISTHTLTWSVTWERQHTLWIHENFNSHAHVERDLWQTTKITYQQAFQLTRSRGAWPWYLLCGLSCKNHFNSHAHVERDFRSFSSVNSIWHFNSHAHVERDRICIELFLLWHISTHTLTWSVTHGYQS